MTALGPTAWSGSNPNRLPGTDTSYIKSLVDITYSVLRTPYICTYLHAELPECRYTRGNTEYGVLYYY